MAKAEKRPGLGEEARPQINVATRYARWYSPATTYADTAHILNDHLLTVTWVVKEGIADPTKRPSVIGDIVVGDGRVTNSFVVDGQKPHHTDGHFNPDVGVSLLPGYMGMGAIIAAASHEQPMLLTDFRIVKYLHPAFPGDTVTASLEQQASGGKIVTNGVVRVNNDPEKIHTFARDLHFAPAPEQDASRVALAQHQEFEVAAQMAGSAVWAFNEFLPEDAFPVFLIIGAMKREPVTIYAGDGLRGIVAVKTMDEKGCAVDLTMLANEQEFTQYDNLRLGFISKDWFMENVVNQRK